ncbi:ubiquitin-like protein [Coniochaeta ligniaria NRRL 30616]|uniref:Ubiquitin-like protein ATG12 n=1 Tax=Coniochaeta ligniaria NRRL 30616 TaxID=1408157 RepID=A0A1J7IBP5_9PEZI|nr:ubiquitin-like protein [Coniochaeta ligniaria NRRL 30616]
MASNPSSPTPGRHISAQASPALPADSSPQASPIAERPSSPDLPLTMTASTVLMHLPRDATAALAAAGGFPLAKVVIRFRPVGAAPAIRQQRVKVTSTQKFENVVAHMRKTLKVTDTESVFLYINNTFAPALDEVVGNLWRCFKDANNELNVSYSMTPAFG